MYRRCRYGAPAVIGIPEEKSSECVAAEGRRARRRFVNRLDRWRQARAASARGRTLVCLCCGATSPYHSGVAPFRESCPRCHAAMTMLRR